MYRITKKWLLVVFVTLIFITGLVWMDRINVRNKDLKKVGKKIVYVAESMDGDRARWALSESDLFNQTTHLINSKLDQGEFVKSSKKAFLSPDRKYLAITVSDRSGFNSPATYITDLAGTLIAGLKPGSFVSWSPNSEYVYSFVSETDGGDERRIYSLNLNGEYSDAGLPEGVISADISSKNGDIVYSRTDKGSDNSSIYIKKSSDSTDGLLVKGNNEIIGWLRWSPDGSRIAFLKTDLGINAESSGVWVVDPLTRVVQKISGIMWGYPPSWSPDGKKLVFSNGDIFEFNLSDARLERVTNFEGKKVGAQPSYSGDGSSIIFSVDDLGSKQIWVSENGSVRQVTDTIDSSKIYPILP